MNIVIVGGGTVGRAICVQLAREDHSITLIDAEESVLTEIANSCDVIGIAGNGANVATLRRAGAEKADLLIAVTSQDEVNILCCAVAKKLGTRQTVARVRNPEYTGLTQFMREEMNLSMTINPELAAAKEIYRMLRFPSAAKIETFCRGRVELAEFTVTPDSDLCGSTLLDLRARFPMRFLVCCVLRGEEVIIPAGSFRVQAGDIISVTAPDDEITDFFKKAGIYRQPIRDVLIVGGGRVTYYLQSLMKRSKLRSTVIERNKELCRGLAEQYSCTVICGNGTNQELLQEEGIAGKDAFLALSDIDEENAIVSLYAKAQGVRKVITKIGNYSYVDFFKGTGLESIVSPQNSIATFLLRYVRAMYHVADSEIESLHRIMDGRAEALEFVIKEEIPGLTGVPLKELKTQDNAIVACILHGDGVLIPSGDDRITCGDTVVVITSGTPMKSIKDIVK